MEGSRESKTAYWRGVVESYESSGLSRRAYSEQNNLIPSQLTYWVRKFQSESEVPSSVKPGFLELSPASSSAVGSEISNLEIEFPGGVVVRLRS